MPSFVVEQENAKQRIDKVLAEIGKMTRSHAQKLIAEDKVLINGKNCKGGQALKLGDVVEYELLEVQEVDVTPNDLPIDIIYQDDDVAVINKPQGMTVHAGCGTKNDTLVNALLYHLDNLSGINGKIRPGIVHRIDKNTSGLLLVAKNDKAHISLAEQIKVKTCKRTYLALVVGTVKEDNGVIITNINRSKKDRKIMAVSDNGRIAETHFKVLTRYKDYTLMEFELKTGRTHQIRVHATHMHHSIVGDKEYGLKKDKFNLNGQLLHAYKIEFVHPTTQKVMQFEAPLPEYFSEILQKLK